MFEGEVVASIPRSEPGSSARVWDVRGSFDSEAALAAYTHSDSVEETAKALLSKMLLIRRFEETAVELVKQGRIIGAIHSSIGQEATAVGICSVLETADTMTGTHRSHGHLLAKGSSPDALMAELFGRITGVSRGRGGSMHIADVSVGALGSSGIVGGGLPLAVGSALAGRLRNEPRISVAFLGDGAANQGMVHEAMNLASVWKTPTIFACENNGYAVSTPSEHAVAGAHIAFRSLAYGFDGCIADGQNVLEMVAVTAKVANEIRTSQAPFLIEAKTYRYREHSEGVSLEYRPDSEINDWITRRDPIQTFVETMESLSVLSPDEVEELESTTQDIISAAVAFAEESPMPDPADLFENLYA